MKISSKITRLGLSFCTLILGCNPTQQPTTNATEKGNVVLASYSPTNDFNAYWYAGKGELNRYDLTIERYGEMRKGSAVCVFVTEDVSAAKQVKLDDPAAVPKDRVPVLKLNQLQRFVTGVYDYSLMQSIFTPVDFKKYPHSLKWNTTVQDWCGHVFTQLNLKDKTFKVNQFSYFEQESDLTFDVDAVLLETELFTRLRIDPLSIPQGKVKMIADLTFSRLRHKGVAAVDAEISVKDGVCHVNYPSLKRQLDINFDVKSPHIIKSWKETMSDGKLISEAILKKTIMSDYWGHHSEADLALRKELGL